MMRLLRRLFWLGLLAGAGVAVYRVVAGRKPPSNDAQPWAPTETARAAPASPAGDAAARWVEPVNGECPSGYPIKANDNSGIFHVPGGRFYARTVAERCYATAEDAIADGYRPAKA